MTILILHAQKKWILDKKLIAIWIASLIILCFSFYQQYIEKIEPCSLCKWQRFIFFLIFAISPIGLIQYFNSSIRVALSFIFSIGFCLSIYHSLVQFGFMADHCTIVQKIENVNDFMLMLEQPKVSCANIKWKLFGISASIYNIIFFAYALINLNFKNIKRFINGRQTQ